MEDNTSPTAEKSSKKSQNSNPGFSESIKPIPIKKKQLKKKQKTGDSSFKVPGKPSDESANVDYNNNGILNSVETDEEMKRNGGRRWNLASFLYPDNNLPKSWLDIMEANKKMSPFDDLHGKRSENIPSRGKGAESTSTDIKIDNSKKSETISIPNSSNSPDLIVGCRELPARKQSIENVEVKDPELATMPELTLSVPGKVFQMENGTKQDQDLELHTDAPTIQPYDSEMIPKSDELPKLIKEIKSNKDEVQEMSPEVSIQIHIIETRCTRKLGVSSPTAASAKSLKRKYGPFIHQQHHVLNYRIKNQISAMQRETKKKFPDIEFLRRNMCLEETFKYRLSKFMKDNEHSIEDLLKEFPALKIVSIIMDEFERVVEVTNPMVRCNPITFLENALKKRYQRILSKFRSLTAKDRLPIISTALEILDKDPKNENLKKIVSSLCMIVNFSTDKCISSVITFKKEKEAFNYQNIGLPKMIMKEQAILQEQTEIRVFLEGQEIFKVANIYEGLLAIFAISHVFNLDYEAKIEPLMRYFEYLVDIPQVLYQEEDPLPSDDEV